MTSILAGSPYTCPLKNARVKALQAFADVVLVQVSSNHEQHNTGYSATVAIHSRTERLPESNSL